MIKRRLPIKIVILFLLSFPLHAQAQKHPRVDKRPTIIDDIKKTVVFLGEVTDKGKPNFRATGFLVNIQKVHHLVTAKHVVVDKNSGKIDDNRMHVFFNSEDGNINQRSIQEIKSQWKINWIFHQNKQVDIAMIPFSIKKRQKDDVKIISDNMFMLPEKLSELYDVFFLSFQPGTQSSKRIIPIFRSGTISLFNDDKTFYIDAFAFPGNSGSPVFLKPTDKRPDGSIANSDYSIPKLIGVIGEYITYQDVAYSKKTKRARIIFEENTGLSKVWSVTLINEIINSEPFKRQLEKILNREFSP